MKVIILAFLSTILTTAVYAQKTIQVTWPFSVSSSQANMIRSVLDNANDMQKKYQFLFVHKPGAGGSVAANFTTTNKDTILASTSSFYIRPLLYNSSHNVDHFRVISGLCVNQPLAIYSNKIQSLGESKIREVTIGVIPGSITTLVTRTMKRENTDLQLNEIPYKGTPEATTDMLGGHVDGSVDFIGTSVISRFGPEVKVLGITGIRQVNTFQTFQSMKIKGLEEVINDYMFFVGLNFDQETFNDIKNILDNAKGTKTKQLCEEDFGQLFTAAANVDNYHIMAKEKWKKLTNGLKKE